MSFRRINPFGIQYMPPYLFFHHLLGSYNFHRNISCYFNMPQKYLEKVKRNLTLQKIKIFLPSASGNRGIKGSQFLHRSVFLYALQLGLFQMSKAWGIIFTFLTPARPFNYYETSVFNLILRLNYIW